MDKKEILSILDNAKDDRGAIPMRLIRQAFDKLPDWIPVSERLPEESEYYIITANDGVGHRTTFAKFQKKAKSWELTGARSYWKVIAWMPLPTPYTK